MKYDVVEKYAYKYESVEKSSDIVDVAYCEDFEYVAYIEFNTPTIAQVSNGKHGDETGQERRYMTSPVIEKRKEM